MNDVCAFVGLGQHAGNPAGVSLFSLMNCFITQAPASPATTGTQVKAHHSILMLALFLSS